jgi:REase_DpnII-MboI
MGEPYLIWAYRLSQLVSVAEYLDSEVASPPNALELVRRICDGFHRSALKLQGRRYAERPSLQIEDEYDVQYSLEALLVGVFSDVRRRRINTQPWRCLGSHGFLVKGGIYHYRDENDASELG